MHQLGPGRQKLFNVKTMILHPLITPIILAQLFNSFQVKVYCVIDCLQ